MVRSRNNVRGRAAKTLRLDLTLNVAIIRTPSIACELRRKVDFGQSFDSQITHRFPQTPTKIDDLLSVVSLG